jgi:hypothetical protein
LPRTRVDNGFPMSCSEIRATIAPHTRGWRVVARSVQASRSGCSARAGMTARVSFSVHRIAGAAGLPRTLCCPQQFVSYSRRSFGASVPRGPRSNPVRSVRPEPGRGRNRFRRLCQKAAGCAHKTPIGRSCLPTGAGARKAESPGAVPLRDRLIPEAVALRDLSIPETRASPRDRSARARMTGKRSYHRINPPRLLRTRGNDGGR